MPRYPAANWRPVTGHTDGPMRSYRGAVLHVNESDGNLYNWVAGNHDMSCHFEVYKDGSIDQYLDTGTTSWCQMAGNADWISIETEGYHTEPLTAAQVHAIAGLYGWLHSTHGIPLQIADTPDGHGFGWHGMGGAAWGGHTDCPGPDRKAQRAQILALATTPNAPATTTPEEFTVDQQAQAQFDRIYNLLYAALSPVGPDGKPHQVGIDTIIARRTNPILAAVASPEQIAAAVVKALPPASSGGLTQADIESAVRTVFADAGQEG